MDKASSTHVTSPTPGNGVEGMPLYAYLKRLVWLCMLPPVALAAWLAVGHIRDAQHSVEREAINLGKSFSATIDQHLSARITALQMLAGSPLLKDPRGYQELYETARGFHSGFGSHVILADADRRMLFNTRTDFGTALPNLPRPVGDGGRNAVQLALDSGQPATGDVVFGPVAKQNLVAVAVPVTRNGSTRLVLLSTFEAKQFDAYLQTLQLPDGWIITLRDGSGQIISQRGAASAGATEAEPVGHRYVFGSAHSAWSTVVEIPQATWFAPIVMNAGALAIAVLVATLTGILGGRWASRRLAASVASLVQQPTTPGTYPRIAEVQQVGRLLGSARQGARHG